LNEDGVYQTRWAFKVAADQPGMRLLDGVTVDHEGNVYISDADASKVRKITPEGKVGVSFALDAKQGELTDTIVDLGVDDDGCLYAARRGGHLIRKYDPAGKLLGTFETYAPVVQMVVDLRELREAGAQGPGGPGLAAQRP
jgi:serine/threonine-protein kinase